jgi:hypothetical protein
VAARCAVACNKVPDFATEVSKTSKTSIESWVAAHFKKVTVGGQTVYDLTQRTS